MRELLQVAPHAHDHVRLESWRREGRIWQADAAARIAGAFERAHG